MAFGGLSQFICDMRGLGQILRMVARILAALVLLAIALFCVFGFLASFEPSNGLMWKVGYGTLACGFLVGAIVMVRAAFIKGGEPEAGESVNRHFVSILLCAMVGGVAALALQWHFSHAWTSYYSHFPWQGYQQAMQEGHVPAFLTTSPRSLLVGSLVLFLLPSLTLLFAGGRPIKVTLALWAGVMAALVTVWVATPRLRQDSNLWPIDLVLVSFITGLPLIAGASAVVLLQKVGLLL